MRHAPEVVPAASVYGVCKRIPEVNFVGNPERISVFIVCGTVLAVTRAENQTGQVPRREPGMNTFSENGNDFVGRLLHEGGVSRRTFSAFPQTQTASTVGPLSVLD